MIVLLDRPVPNVIPHPNDDRFSKQFDSRASKIFTKTLSSPSQALVRPRLARDKLLWIMTSRHVNAEKANVPSPKQ